MAEEKTCCICGAIDSASIVVSITYENGLLSVGSALGNDYCALHRDAAFADYFAQCKTNIDAAIPA